MGATGCQLRDCSETRLVEPLRVLIDARKLGQGGIGVYLDNLIAGLLEQQATEVTLIARAEQLSPYSWAKAVSLIADSAPLYSFDELWCMPKRIDMSQFDLFHVPHFTLPYGIRIPTVITVHDLIQIRYPEKFFYPWVAGPLVRSALRRATRVLTVSQATYADLLALTRNNQRIAGKIRIVPNALDPCFAQVVRNPDYVSQRFQIRGKYLLSVFSNLKPHKGLEDLLRAFDSIRNGNGKTGGELKLVLSGQGTQELVQVERLLEIAGSINGVHILGRVNKEELASLYANALGVVIPSYADGFCLPVLEAQAVGVPVLARPTAAVQELLTANDFVCDDFSFDALKQALAKFITIRLSQVDSPAVVLDCDRIKRFCRKELSRLVREVYQEAVDQVRA